VIRSLNTKQFFGFELPENDPNYVRMVISKGYHYFEYVDAETTKYIALMNADPLM
jgi:hypothetical protein